MAEKWSDADSAAATAEGWNIFDSDERGLEIERIDCPDDRDEPAFDCDDAAVAHCVRRAAEGSEMHKRALTIYAESLKGD